MQKKNRSVCISGTNQNYDLIFKELNHNTPSNVPLAQSHWHPRFR
jgi:hypothetical protein